MQCPLCHYDKCEFFYQDKKRSYVQCTRCALVFVPKTFHLTAELEKAEYDKHDNQNDDIGYRRFLSRTLDPLLARLPSTHLGLDYGCGQGAVLSKMAGEQGVKVDNYDLFYYPETAPLKRSYGFITMTEVLEHIADPAALLPQLVAMLQPNGVLAIMTKRVLNVQAFSRWHYKNDPTHICFYSERTFWWLAKKYSLKLEFIAADVVFLTKLK
ncbi:methyltransferase domain-containing protein [Gayadomonas joobiniege]|uniref:class I SAM-dependent methyltransferase n=1 Tax=Gayadomonas joobiniege TaxID=1234606 RepID=UPI0003812177